MSGRTRPPKAPAVPTAAWLDAGIAAEDYFVPHVASSHERAITPYFAGDVAFRPERHAVAAPGAVLVCFTNRCGSNFLVGALNSSPALRGAGEALNGTVVLERSREAGHRSFQAYVESAAVAGKADAGHPLLLKLGWMQLFMLDRWGYLDTVFADARFIFVRREDLLAQAVSHAIASGSRAWTSNAEERAAEVAFDAAIIQKNLNLFTDANAQFERFFALSGRPVTRVTYEAFAADPAAWVETYGRSAGLPLAFLPEFLRLKRQDDPRKAEYMSRIVAMVRAGARIE